MPRPHIVLSRLLSAPRVPSTRARQSLSPRGTDFDRIPQLLGSTPQIIKTHPRCVRLVCDTLYYYYYTHGRPTRQGKAVLIQQGLYYRTQRMCSPPKTAWRREWAEMMECPIANATVHVSVYGTVMIHRVCDWRCGDRDPLQQSCASC